MAQYIQPLDEFTKVFEIVLTKKEIEELNGQEPLCEHKPFYDYMSLFDDTYGFYITVSKSTGLFGKTCAYYYTIHLYKIKEF